MWADNEGHLPQIKTQCSESSSSRPLSGWNKSAAKLLQRESVRCVSQKNPGGRLRSYNLHHTVETTRTEGICTKIGWQFKAVRSQKDPPKPLWGMLLHKQSHLIAVYILYREEDGPFQKRQALANRGKKGELETLITTLREKVQEDQNEGYLVGKCGAHERVTPQ